MDAYVRSKKVSDSIFLQGAVTNLSIICNSNFCNCCPLGDDVDSCPYQIILKRKNELLKELEGE